MFDKMIDRTGTYCTQWDFVKDRFGQEGLLPFTISDTDFSLPSPVLNSLKKRLEHPVFGYTRWNHEAFKQAIDTWYVNRFNLSVPSEWVVYSPSVIYSVAKLIELKSEVGDGIVVQVPAYDAFFKVIEDNNRCVVANHLIYQEGHYSIDFEDLEEKLSEERSKILLLCSPHNPTGRVWSEKELLQMIALCEKYQVFIISDEIHMDIVRKGNTHHPILEFIEKEVALVTSGSKTFNFPGLIFSYALLPDDTLREEFLITLKNRDGLSSTSTLGMEATMSSYLEGEQWLDELNGYLEDNEAYVKQFLEKEFPDIRLVKAEATYLLWLDVSACKYSMEEIQNRLINIGKVAIMNGEVYGGNGQQFLRLNIGCPKEKLMDGLERMKKSLK